MSGGGYPEYRINRQTSYRVPPGWADLVSELMRELDDMRSSGILGQDFQVTQVFDSNGSMAAALAGRFRQEHVAGLLRAYSDRSRQTCAECGYEGIRACRGRPTCGACKGAKSRNVR